MGRELKPATQGEADIFTYPFDNKVSLAQEPYLWEHCAGGWVACGWDNGRSLIFLQMSRIHNIGL